MVQINIMVWDVDHETTGVSSGDLNTLWTGTSRWMISFNHCDFSKFEIFSSTHLHFLGNAWWHSLE